MLAPQIRGSPDSTVWLSMRLTFFFFVDANIFRVPDHIAVKKINVAAFSSRALACHAEKGWHQVALGKGPGTEFIGVPLPVLSS